MARRQMGSKEIAALLGRTEKAVEAKLYMIGGTRAVAGRAVKRQQRRRNGASFFLS